MELLEVQIPVRESLHRFFDTQKSHKEFLINTPIVNVIIGDMLWDTEDIKGQTYANMMAFFIDCADDSEELHVVQGRDC